ncbi:FMN-binding negative transcriptional regulator [Solicola sp. PLA-1-18]|uniref:FMN-binding negative transcriptional regulator n=1 Tax=Solicola sp. PLA-1-18 TaxID=3380532 RepID=UPI003B7A444D
MYVPPANRVDDPDAVRAMVEGVGAADLVTVGPDGVPVSTLLPVLWSEDGSTVVAHMARANEHWTTIADDAPALAIVSGAQAYVTPSWYAAKAEHGRVVPTWNYSAVHLTGTVRVHDDPDWVRDAVTRLTLAHESTRQAPWAVEDAPAAFVAGQLRAIVGLEMTVTRVEAKAKLSQNRSEADRAGVVAGLRAQPDPRSQAMADQVASAVRPPRR